MSAKTPASHWPRAYTSILVGALLLGCWLWIGAPASAAVSITDETVSNIADNRFTVSWTTNEIANGYVRYGTASSQQTFQAEDVRGSSFRGYNHFVTVANLIPNQTYYLTVYSSDTPSALQPVTTGSSIGAPASTLLFIGRVMQRDGQTPATDTVVIVTVQRSGERSSALSAVVNADGTFDVNLQYARTLDLTSYITPSSSTDRVSYTVYGGPGNTVTNQIDASRIFDGEEIDVTLPNDQLPTATPSGTVTVIATNTATSAPTSPTATPTSTSAPTIAPTATPTLGPSATPTPSPPLPTSTPVARVIPTSAPPTSVAQETPVVPIQPISDPGKSTAPIAATPTAFFRPAPGFDVGSRMTQTAVAVIARRAGAVEPTSTGSPTPITPVPSPTTVPEDIPPTPIPPVIQGLMLAAGVLIAAGFGLVTTGVISSLRRRSA